MKTIYSEYRSVRRWCLTIIRYIYLLNNNLHYKLYFYNHNHNVEYIDKIFF